MTPEEKQQRIEQAEKSLAELGSTSLDIALNLQKLGIKGIVGDSESCPIANYLSKQFNFKAGVCNADIGVYADDVPYSFVPSKVVSDFIDNFDKEQYPFLVAEEEDLDPPEDSDSEE